MFSSRVQADLTPNRLAQALDRVRVEGRPFIDFTESNPTRAGFLYPQDALKAFADPRGLLYAPEPFGALQARRAVASEFERRGLTVAPERIVLTASTSEAYSLLFKLLCDPGDEVLVPRPSYPLFEHLTRLDGVTAQPYDLEYQGSWTIDFVSLERGLSASTRAVLVVSPNNPTGSFLKQDELERLAALCVQYDVAIVADEVFAEYAWPGATSGGTARVLAVRDGLAFSLGGLSKSAGLPQVKVGWIAAAGGEAIVRE